MSVKKNLFPEIVPFNNFGSWDVYTNALYAIFKQDFIDSKPKVGQVVFKLKYKPKFQDRAYTFYHMTHKGNIEDERLPDMRRCERLPWCRPTIEKADVYNLCFWEEEAQGGLSVAGGCRCLTKDGNTSIEKEGYIPYPLQA